MELLFDIETNGLLPEVSKLHCVGYSVDGGPAQLAVTPEQWDEFYALAHEADVLIGHNILGYDVPVLNKLSGGKFWIKPGAKYRDTVIIARVLHSDLAERDAVVSRRRPEIRPYIGQHRLEAWGVRLKCEKGDFGKQTDWAEYTEEMGVYCKQDIETTKALYKHLTTKAEELGSIGLSAPWVELEQEFSQVMDKMMANGVPFLVPEADKLAATLNAEVTELRQELEDKVPPLKVEMKTPQCYIDRRNQKTYRIKGDCPPKERKYLVPGPPKVKLKPFNPGSRDDITRYLVDECGWSPQPEDFTPTGKPKISETILSGLDFPLVGKLRKYLLVNKRLSQLQDGAGAWLKKVKPDHKIYGRIHHNATVTHRCAHSGPNLGQVPSPRHEYGKEMRGLFGHAWGVFWVMVGADLSQLELRMLAHFLAEFDGGEYIDLVLKGDIHTANQKAAGLDTRDQAKTFIYALIYGAGDAKIGEIVGGDINDGRRIKRRFFKKMPAFKQLQDKLKEEARDKGYLVNPLDGRRLPVRSEHKLLNVLLQSSGAIVAKKWNVNIDKYVYHEAQIKNGEFGYTGHGEFAHQVLFVHDEVQFAYVRPDDAEELGAELVQCAADIQDQLALRIPIDAEYSIGRTWADTH